MTKFVLLFALFGLVAVAAWGRSRRHRREKGTLTPESSPVRSPVAAELKTIESRHTGVAPTTQALETVQPVGVVASPESMGDSAVAEPSEANPALSGSEPNNIPPEQAAKSLPTDSQPTGVTAALPTPVVDALPNSSPALETPVFTSTELINANGQPALIETSISQCISSEPVADDEKQRPSPPIVVPTKSNVIEEEHAVVSIMDTVEVTISSEPPSEAKGGPDSCLVQTGQCISSEPVADDEAQRPSPPIVVPTKSNVIEAEHAHVPIVNAVEGTVPSEPPSEAEEGPDSSPVLTDAVTNSRQATDLPPSIQNEQPRVESLPQRLSEVIIPTRLPDYRPLAPVSPAGPLRSRRPATARPAPNTSAELRLRVQLVLGRGGDVKTLALVPDRREEMPDEIEITGMQGELRLTEPLENCYQSVPLADAGSALRQGVEWRGNGDARRWRWILTRRELYVLAPGDEFGLSGFVSTARLLLNARHVVLAMAHLRNEVLAALAETGSATPQVNDDTTPGVPSGWLLFRDVTPTRAVPMWDEAHILNALCPLPDIEPHFVGGIRLERRTWLAGFPPRIRFTGALGDDFRPMIDGKPAQLATDGAFEAPGWDNIEEHRLWFGGQIETYALRMMDERWEPWRAHDFGAGTAICGAMTHPPAEVQRQQVQVPVTNPLLLGARPGEVFHCHPPSDLRCETVRTLVPFVPVWALPLDPAHADKRSARILLFHPTEPVANIQISLRNRTANRALVAWISAIHEAGCKGLILAADGGKSTALWQRYRNAAKQLRRKMR